MLGELSLHGDGIDLDHPPLLPATVLLVLSLDEVRILSLEKVDAPSIVNHLRHLLLLALGGGSHSPWIRKKEREKEREKERGKEEKEKEKEKKQEE